MLPPITATAGCNYSSDGGYYSHDFDYGPTCMFYNHPTIMLPPTTATAVATTLPTEAITVVILATDPVLKNR
jgi:hypothetical protein